MQISKRSCCAEEYENWTVDRLGLSWYFKACVNCVFVFKCRLSSPVPLKSRHIRNKKHNKARCIRHIHAVAGSLFLNTLSGKG